MRRHDRGDGAYIDASWYQGDPGDWSDGCHLATIQERLGAVHWHVSLPGEFIHGTAPSVEKALMRVQAFHPEVSIDAQ